MHSKAMMVFLSPLVVALIVFVVFFPRPGVTAVQEQESATAICYKVTVWGSGLQRDHAREYVTTTRPSIDNGSLIYFTDIHNKWVAASGQWVCEEVNPVKAEK